MQRQANVIILVDAVLGKDRIQSAMPMRALQRITQRDGPVQSNVLAPQNRIFLRQDESGLDHIWQSTGLALQAFVYRKPTDRSAFKLSRKWSWPSTPSNSGVTGFDEFRMAADNRFKTTWSNSPFGPRISFK